ncbi:MAG: ABC transporter permease [Acidobacteriota bacterium]|jgi:ABC-2 type transport system permease protein
MRRVLLQVRKDLLRRVRQPLGYLLLLAFPVLFAGMLALTFGGGGGGGVPRIRLLVEDDDRTALSGLLTSALGSSQLATYFEVEALGEEEDGGARMERGEASALLHIPEGFGEAILEGEPTYLELIRNPAERILPEAAEQSAAVLAELLSAASRLLRGPLDRVRGLAEAGGEHPADADVAAIAVEVNRILRRSDTFLLPPAITLESGPLPYEEPSPEDEEAEAGPESTTGLIFLMVFPGVAVYALFVLGDQAMRDLLVEAEAGTLRRQLAGPMGPGTLLLAKALYTAVLSLLSLLILAGIAAIAADGPVRPVAFVLLSLSLVLAITGLAATIYGLAPSQRRGATISSLLYLAMAFGSGSFVQLDSLPAAMRRAAPFTPLYWANQGYRDLLVSGAGVADLLPHIGILAGSGAVLLGLGAALLRRQVLRGAVS